MYFQYQIIMTMIKRRDWVVSHVCWLAVGECDWGTSPLVPLWACASPDVAPKASCFVTLRKDLS